MVDPEGDPREHDDEDTGEVSLEHEVADVPGQVEADGEATVDSGGQRLSAVVCLVTHDGELRQLGLLHAHHRDLLPVHHHVVHRVAVCWWGGGTVRTGKKKNER